MSRAATLAGGIDEVYRSGAADPDFRTLLERFPASDDARLAELIEADGRARIRRNQSVDLGRYLDAIENLPGRPDALDAAIDMALRWLAKTGRPDHESVATLAGAHPRLEPAIRDAAALGNVIWSTRRVQRGLAEPRRVRDLPCDFGPRTEDGRHRYNLQRLLGEGSFGEVYLAVDRQLSEADHPALVSIKVLHGTEGGPWQRQRLIDEATKARRVDHPHVVRVLDRGVSDHDEDFVVYEFVEGGDLVKWSRQQGRPLPPRVAADLVAKVARGIHAAHVAGLVHCDLKPGNILITADGAPRVADFGIAIRAADETEARRRAGTDDEQPAGNLAFMSPEQFRLEPGGLTFPSDIYAVGGILFWLLTDRLPNGASVEEIRATHDRSQGRPEPPAPRDRHSEIDRDLDAIVRRAMAVQPQDRYASADALAADLESWRRREPIHWVRPSLRRRLALWVRRKPGLAATLGVVVLLTGAGGVTLARMAEIAREKELQETRRQMAVAVMKRFVGDLKKAQNDGVTTELLPKIWFAEWLFGPTVLGEGTAGAELWKVRRATVRALLDEARARGRADDLEPLLWESALGFWLLADGNWREAEPLLASNAEHWRGRLDPDDPWLADLRSLQGCALVRRRAEGHGDGDDAALRAAVEDIDRTGRSLAQRAAGSPLHRMMLRHLAVAWSPELLDDATRRAEVQAKLDALDED